MKSYWSNTKFADWLRGTKQPYYATSTEWNEWRMMAKASHPFRYWFVEEALDSIQMFFRSPLTLAEDIKYYLRNRFVDKPHLLSSTLKKGEWHEMDNRMLFCLMDSMVNFVEDELAHHYMACNGKKYHNKANAGLDYLRWAMSLTNIDYKRPEEPEEPTQQAIYAKELFFIYDWWKYVRPNRKEPGEDSGWDALCDKREKAGHLFLDWKETEEEKAETKKILDLYRKLENEHYQEDTNMLIKLINIRQGLWT